MARVRPRFGSAKPGTVIVTTSYLLQEKEKDRDRDSKKVSKKDKERHAGGDKPRRDVEPPRLIPRTLGGDNRVKATYEARAATDSQARAPPVVVSFALTNTCAFDLKPVSLSLTSSMVARVAAPPADVACLRAGEEGVMRAELSVGSATKPLKVRCAAPPSPPLT